jgi:hypothetical protein
MSSDAPDSDEEPDSGDGPGGDEEQAPSSSGPGGGNSKDEAEGQTPLEKSDRYTTGTVSREEWIRLLNEADPWDQRLKAQKEFERTDPPVRSVKIYRQKTRYFLLNRGKQAIDRLRYRAHELDVNLRRAEGARLYELKDLPQESYVEVGRMDLGGQRRMTFTLVSARWEGGQTFEAESRDDERRLPIFDHSDHVPSLDGLDLSAAPTEPVVVDL